MVNESRDSRVHGRTRKRRAPVTPKDVIEAITTMTLAKVGPTEIGRRLKADPKFAGRVPQPRTIKRYVALAKGSSDVSEPWRLADADPDEAALVVPVIAAVVEHTAGRVQSVSKAEAAWIVKIVGAAGDIDPWDAYRLARLLLSDPDAERDVQQYLSFAPWRDDG